MHSRMKNHVQPHNLRGRMILPLVYACMRDARFRMLNEVLARDEWSAEQIKMHQGKRLERLFYVAWAHNPYWREKFEQYGVNHRGSDPFAELAKLPILTKDEVRANYRRMRSTHLPDREIIYETSSGSTGRQVYVWHTRYYQQLHTAMEYRSQAWMGVRPGDPYLNVCAHGAHLSRKKLLLRFFRTILDGGFIIDAFHIDPEPTKQLLRRAQKHRPVHVYGYPTAMATVAQLSRNMGLKWPTVRAVSTSSEQLFDEDRKLLGDVYGAKVYDRYGCREVQSIAVQCREGNHHIYADLNYVEFVQVKDTDEGYEAILLTPLDNEAMPMFRYRNGDCASAVEGICPCGSALPLMTGCQGRICNNFITRDGRIINGTYFLLFFLSQEGYQAYQFHQTTPEHIDLYVVPDGELTAERRRYLDSVCDRAATDFNSSFEVDLHIVDEIPRTPGGKHLYILSDCLKYL